MKPIRHRFDSMKYGPAWQAKPCSWTGIESVRTLFPWLILFGILVSSNTAIASDSGGQASGVPLAAGNGFVSAESGFLADLEAWKNRRRESLLQEAGWLTLVGLYWFQEGENRFGSDPGGELVLGIKDVPPLLATFQRKGNQVSVEVPAGLHVTHGGEVVGRLPLRADADGNPTLLEYGTISFYVIRRGQRVGLRVKDRKSPVYLGFRGVDSFPPSLEWRIEGRLIPAPGGTTVAVPNVLGQVNQEVSPGKVLFQYKGMEYGLIPLQSDPKEDLFFVFGDTTNGRETYGGGRFLVARPPAPDGTVVLDFNRATNPPCVFTPYATCPLPPKENRLNLRVEAGERMYGPPHEGGKVESMPSSGVLATPP